MSLVEIMLRFGGRGRGFGPLFYLIGQSNIGSSSVIPDFHTLIIGGGGGTFDAHAYIYDRYRLTVSLMRIFLTFCLLSKRMHFLTLMICS